jgi:hypothetical protein
LAIVKGSSAPHSPDQTERLNSKQTPALKTNRIATPGFSISLHDTDVVFTVP